MNKEKRNAVHGQCGGASNVIPLDNWNASKFKPKLPKKQEISGEQAETIMLEGLRMCLEWDRQDTTATSRWLLSIASRAYRTEGLLL